MKLRPDPGSNEGTNTRRTRESRRETNHEQGAVEKKNQTEARGQAARAPVGNPRCASQQDRKPSKNNARASRTRKPSKNRHALRAGQETEQPEKKISGRILHRKMSGNTVRVRQNGSTRGRRKITLQPDAGHQADKLKLELAEDRCLPCTMRLCTRK
jgi:hypothetical protein